MTMSSNFNKDLPDLLRGTGEFDSNNIFGSQQVCLPAVKGSYMITDIEQAEAGTTHYGSAPLDGRQNAGARSSLNTPLQWNPSQMNHALRNSAQQTNMSRAHLNRMLPLAVPQASFPASHGPLALQSVENANDGRFGPGHSAGHVRPRKMMREERVLVDTRRMNPNSPDSNRLFFRENETRNMAIQAPSSSFNFNFQNQAMQVSASSVSRPEIQQQSHARNERMAFGSPSYHQSMQIVSQLGETPYDAMMDGNPALVGMYGAPDSRSYARDMVSRNLGPELLSDQIQGVVSALSESLVCYVCQKEYRDKPTLRYVW